jgi:hypothetical protein
MTVYASICRDIRSAGFQMMARPRGDSDRHGSSGPKREGIGMCPTRSRRCDASHPFKFADSDDAARAPVLQVVSVPLQLAQTRSLARVRVGPSPSRSKSESESVRVRVGPSPSRSESGRPRRLLFRSPGPPACKPRGGARGPGPGGRRLKAVRRRRPSH